MTASWTPLPPPDLKLAKQHSGSFRVGQTGSYTLTVTNVGRGPTTQTLVITDTLPTGFNFVGASGTGWSCGGSGQIVTCANPSVLLPDTITSVKMEVAVSSLASAVSTNVATVATAGDTNSSNDTASDPTNVVGAQGGVTPTPTPPSGSPVPTPTATATSTVRPRPAIMGARLVAVGRVPAGSVMYYTIVVVISGKGVIPDVHVTLALPAEVQLVTTSVAPTSQPASGTAGGIVTWALGDLAPPGNVSLKVQVAVRSDLPIGTKFTAQATVSNGLGKAKILHRVSRIGNGNLH